VDLVLQRKDKIKIKIISTFKKKKERKKAAGRP
jgi:hypothetical protein